MITKSFSIIAFAFLSQFAIPVYAGWMMVAKTTATNSGSEGKMNYYTSDKGIRFEVKSTVNGKSYDSTMICNSKTKKIKRLMNGKEMQQPAGMGDYKAMMEKQMAKMPPEQRKMFEENMKKMKAKTGEHIKAQMKKNTNPIRKVGGTYKVGKWNTQKYEQDSKDGKVEFYVTTETNFKYNPAETEASKICNSLQTEGMDETFKEMGLNTKKDSPFPPNSWVVKMVSPNYSMEVLSFEQKNLPASLFE